MSLLGWIFWVGLLGLIVIGFVLDKKRHSNTPEKSFNQDLNEAIITKNVKQSSDFNNFGGGPPGPS